MLRTAIAILAALANVTLVNAPGHDSDTRPFRSEDVCSETVLRLRPDGQALALLLHHRRFLTESPSGDGGVSLLTLTVAGIAPLATTASINPLRPLGWSDDVFLAQGTAGRVFAFDQSGASLLGALPALPRTQYIDAEELGEFDESPSDLRDALAAAFTRRYHDLDAGVLFIGRFGEHWLTLAGLGRDLRLDGKPLSIAGFDLYAPTLAGGVHPEVVNTGEVPTGADFASAGLDSRTIIDGRSGRAVGSVSTSRVEYARSTGWAPVRAGPLDRIVDAAVAGDSRAVLVQSGSRRTLTWTRNDRTASLEVDCPVLPDHPDRPPKDFFEGQAWDANAPFPIRAREEAQLGSRARPLLAEYAPAQGHTLAVVFVGGPNTPIEQAGGVDALAPYLPADTALLVPAYSGKVGAGEATRARLVHEPGALERDAATVKAFADAHGYPRVVIVGISFGAVPALALRRMIGPPAPLILIAPALAYPSSPDEQRAALGSVNPVGQHNYELAAFGGEDRLAAFGSRVRRLVAATPLGPGDTAVLSQRDANPDFRPGGRYADTGAKLEWSRWPHAMVSSSKQIGALITAAATR